MNFTEQGRVALDWFLDGKEVECRHVEDQKQNPWFVLAELADVRLFSSDKHEFRIKKPRLKLVDMSKLPRGTMTNIGEIINYPNYPNQQGVVGVLYEGQFHFGRIDNLRIAEQFGFTYWGGGECPVPDGLIVEIMLRHGQSQKISTGINGVHWRHTEFRPQIIGYRITGLADGWTDVPSEALE